MFGEVSSVGGGGGAPGSSSCGGGVLSFVWKLFMEANALTSVPLTEKWPSDSSDVTSGCARIVASSLRDSSIVSSRSRFLPNAVGTHAGSSAANPTNQPNSRL